MPTSHRSIDRRRVLQRLALGLGAPWSASALAQTAPKGPALATKPIPSTGEALPVVGLGTWITFNVGNDRVARDACAEVDARVLRRRRPDDRLVADVRLVAGVIGYGLREASAPAAQSSPPTRSGSSSGRARAGADRGVAPALERRPLRPAAGPQPAALAGAPADAVRDEGGGPAPLRRHHHVGRAAPSRDRADHAQPAARLRAGHLQPARPRGRGSASCRSRASAASR